MYQHLLPLVVAIGLTAIALLLGQLKIKRLSQQLEKQSIWKPKEIALILSPTPLETQQAI